MGRFKRAVIRFRQFRRALTAKVEATDLDFLRKYLSEQERALFYQMDRIDQRHCLDVAKYAYQTATARGLGSTRTTVVKAALLHDIGKVSGHSTLLGRVLYVLRSRSAKMVGDNRLGGLAGHAERGAHMAEVFGIDPAVVSLIREHHQSPSCDVAALLQEADNLF